MNRKNQLTFTFQGSMARSYALRLQAEYGTSTGVRLDCNDGEYYMYGDGTIDNE